MTELGIVTKFGGLDRGTDGQTDRGTDGQTDSWTDEETESQTYVLLDIHTDRHGKRLEGYMNKQIADLLMEVGIKKILFPVSFQTFRNVWAKKNSDDQWITDFDGLFFSPENRQLTKVQCFANGRQAWPHFQNGMHFPIRFGRSESTL